MTSQMWLNETFVDKPIWWHWVWIVVPTTVKHSDYATIVGTGGDNRHYDIDSAPSRGDVFFIACQEVARTTGSICAVLYQIPNEPLTFYNDPLHKSRSEDAILAFGWNVFSQYDPSDDERYQWIGHFPMAKATVRGMDTIAAFATEHLKLPEIKRFGVSGASKRGWSAWLTAAADQRIEVMAPIVMDMCNFHPNLHHQYRAYGGWTWAFQDYYAENITQDLDDAWFADLLAAADPYAFFDRYNERKLAKFVVDGTWDEFFMPDDEQFWWADLQQPKYFLMNADADHSQATAIETDIPSLATFIGSYLNEVEMPEIEWEISDSEFGNITLTFNGDTTGIVDAVVWHGRSCGNSRRDFRMLTLDDPCKCGVSSGGYCFNLESLFTPIQGLQPVESNATYARYEVNPPTYPEGYWEAFMVGLKYRAFESDVTGDVPPSKATPMGRTEEGQWRLLDENGEVGDESWFVVRYGEIVLTSQISIVQKDYPFADCSGETCKGTLV